MRKIFVGALALSLYCTAAAAADSDGLKDPLPDQLTWHGLTVYGLIDIGYAYQTNGAPFSGAFYPGLDYNMFGEKQNRQTISALTNNAISQSFVGVKFQESLGHGLTVLGNVDTAFNPLSGELADNCASAIRNNGKPLSQASSAGDGSRCGQAINGQAFIGLSNELLGKITIGRQNSLVNDLLNAYDPMGMAYATSLVGWSGSAGSGVGMTETSRWDNALKYTYAAGPLRAGFMFASGAQDSSLHGDSYAANLGLTVKGISIDAVYTKEKDGVYANGPYSYTSATACGTVSTPACNTLSVIGENSQAWTIAAKYSFDLAGGLKDLMPAAKLTVYSGYQHADLSNATDPLSVGDTTINGYLIGKVDNTALTTNKVGQSWWVGGKYELPSGLSFALAYYRYIQNNYVKDGVACTAGGASASNCAGASQTVSFLADYAINKHVDVYTGVSYSDVSGGVSSGYVGALDNTTVVSGLRLRF